MPGRMLRTICSHGTLGKRDALALCVLRGTQEQARPSGARCDLRVGTRTEVLQQRTAGMVVFIFLAEEEAEFGVSAPLFVPRRTGRERHTPGVPRFVPFSQ